jgi:hypothetical protein
MQHADYLVHSFTTAGVVYRVAVIQITADPLHGGNYSALTSCSCPSFTHNENKCKHLFLASRITGLPLRPPPRVGAPTGPAGVALPPALPPADAVSNDEVVAEKRSLIELLQKEADAVAARVQRLSSMPLEKLSRVALCSLGETATRLCRDLNEVLSSAPLYAFQM